MWSKDFVGRLRSNVLIEFGTTVQIIPPGFDDSIEFNQGFHAVRSVFDDVRSYYVIQRVGHNR